jgi:hypothetical protein
MQFIVISCRGPAEMTPSAEWVQENRERRNAYMREWNRRNPESRRYHQKRVRADHPARLLLYKAKERAKAKGLEFDLTEEDLQPLPIHCPVFGTELNYAAPKQCAASPSLDRVDNSKGYVKGNVVVVSWRANNLKSNASVAELRALVRFYEGRE